MLNFLWQITPPTIQNLRSDALIGSNEATITQGFLSDPTSKAGPAKYQNEGLYHLDKKFWTGPFLSSSIPFLGRGVFRPFAVTHFWDLITHSLAVQQSMPWPTLMISLSHITDLSFWHQNLLIRNSEKLSANLRLSPLVLDLDRLPSNSINYFFLSISTVLQRNKWQYYPKKKQSNSRSMHNACHRGKMTSAAISCLGRVGSGTNSSNRH